MNSKKEKTFSISQLEERYEMTVASTRSDDPCEDGEPCLTVSSW